MTLQTLDQQDSWSAYWRIGTLTTFKGGRFDRGYDGSVRDFFADAMVTLAPEATVLDLATGNGGLALLAAQIARDTDLRCRVIGIDYAEIKPGADADLSAEQRALMQGIEFRGGVRMEATGQPGASVDLVISAYGFEYGNTSEILGECRRILRPDGKLAVLVHDRDSVVVKQAADSVRLLTLALDELNLAGLSEALMQKVGSATTAEEMRSLGRDPATETLRQALNDALAKLYSSAAGNADMQDLATQIGTGFLEIFTRHRGMPLAAKLGAIETRLKDWRAFSKRLEHMLDVALDDDACAAIQRKALDLGFRDVTHSRLHYGGEKHLIGRTLSASTPA